jgi:carbonic anhydrase/acetyltransferase-like protein (isoleucine patch superfamily)
MNATILHDVEIGDYCIIGAGCLVGEKMKIPDGSFVVGVPGRIKGKATKEHLWWVENAPGIYKELTKQYKELGLESPRE